MGEQRESMSTKRVLAGEQSGEDLVSRRLRVALGSGHIYIHIYIIYTPNVGFAVTLPGPDLMEQGRFRGSTDGSVGAQHRGA